MRTIQILLMPLEDGYRAAVQGFGMLDSHSLDWFRHRIYEAIMKRVGPEPVELEFALSNDLRPHYPTCAN